MGQLSISGAVVGGPPNASEGFPTALWTVQLRGRQNPRGFNAASGVLQQRVGVAAPSFLTLPCVGATGPVTRGDYLYIRSDGPVLLRLTRDDGIGGNVVSTEDIDGTLMLEYSATKFLKLLEVQGSATLEYLCTGMQ